VKAIVARIARSRRPTTSGIAISFPSRSFTVFEILIDPSRVRACSTVISGVLPSITSSLTPLTVAAGLRTQTCRCTSRSKKPRSAARCRFCLDGDPPRSSLR
jgi:hypothetical protein